MKLRNSTHSAVIATSPRSTRVSTAPVVGSNAPPTSRYVPGARSAARGSMARSRSGSFATRGSRSRPSAGGAQQSPPMQQQGMRVLDLRGPEKRGIGNLDGNDHSRHN
jgi:hypothetical protein